MAYSTQDLGQLFGAALKSLSDNRKQINELDGQNGNHGDNMVHNLRVIEQTLQSHSQQPPADALKSAAKVLQTEGKGGASQHYAKGLTEAAAQLTGKQSLNNDDISALVQTLLGSVPVGQSSSTSSGQPPHKPHVKPVIGAEPEQGQPAMPGGDLLGGLASLLGGGQPESPSASAPTGAGSVLDLLGGLGGQTTQSNNQPGLDMGDVLNAGLAFFQAQQSGADTGTAAMQAFQAAMSDSNPMQSGSPRAAAGGLIAQTILGMLTGNK